MNVPRFDATLTKTPSMKTTSHLASLPIIMAPKGALSSSIRVWRLIERTAALLVVLAAVRRRRYPVSVVRRPFRDPAASLNLLTALWLPPLHRLALPLLLPQPPHHTARWRQLRRQRLITARWRQPRLRRLITARWRQLHLPLLTTARWRRRRRPHPRRL